MEGLLNALDSFMYPFQKEPRESVSKVETHSKKYWMNILSIPSKENQLGF